MHARRRVWQCQRCGAQTSVTAGTVMHNTQTPLRLWFWAAYLVATHLPGISAVQLAPQLGISRHERAWMMLHKLKRAMVAPERESLGSEVAVAVEVRGRGSGRVRSAIPENASGRSLGGLELQGVAAPHPPRAPQEHLQAYLDEFVFRQNRRGNPHAAFQTLLGLTTRHQPASCRQIIDQAA